MEDTLVDIFDGIEVITDDEVNNISDKDIITIDEIFSNQKEEDNKEDIFQINNVETIEPVLVEKKDKVLMIQIILLVAWIILTVLIYFYGYDFFEPFIKVS